MIFATVSRVCLFTRKQLWSNYWVCAECLLASFTCSLRTGRPCLAARPKRWREQGELAAALRLLLQVDAVRVCVIEVTLVLYQRGPGLLAGGNAAETSPDTGEGCWRKKGPGVGPCVPKAPQRSSLLSGVHLHSPGWKAVAVVWFLVQVCRQESPPGEKMILQNKIVEMLQSTCENSACTSAQTSSQLFLNYSIRLTWFHYVVESEICYWKACRWNKSTDLGVDPKNMQRHPRSEPQLLVNKSQVGFSSRRSYNVSQSWHISGLLKDGGQARWE